MKKLLLLTFALLIAIVGTSFAQLTPIKSTKGVSAAETKASQELNDPELLAVVTINGAIETSIGDIGVDASLETGLSTAWIYLFRDRTDQSELRTFAATESFLGFQVINISEFGFQESLPKIPELTLDGVTWKDFSEVCLNLKDNSNYKSYMQKYPEAEAKLISLTVNENAPFLNTEEPYWVVTTVDEETKVSIICGIHAESGETLCAEISGVEESDEAALEVYPNPANDVALVTVPAEILSDASALTLFDSQGKLVREYPYSPDTANGAAVISTSDLTPGTYYLNYQTQKGTYSTKIVVAR